MSRTEVALMHKKWRKFFSLGLTHTRERNRVSGLISIAETTYSGKETRFLRKFFSLGMLSFLGSLMLFLALVNPAASHWADLSVAEIVVGKTETQITLTFPTGMAAFADDNHDGQLSPEEIRTHDNSLKSFLSDRIRLDDGLGQNQSLTLKPLETAAIPSTTLQTSTHSTLLLNYTWRSPVQNLRIHYNLFEPGVSTASCQATILQDGSVQSFVFTPTNQEYSLLEGNAPWSKTRNFLLAILGCLVWGGMHALSPGHGKTIVGAYLIGSRATVKHALFLALTTTITHTAGVFALGLATLFASDWILPDRLYPWLSLLSGLMVVAIGLNLCIGRWREALRWNSGEIESRGRRGGFSRQPFGKTAKPAPIEQESYQAVDLLSRKSWQRELTPMPASVTLPHPGHHHHHHGHLHDSHSHLPPGADGEPVTWKSLLALGISGGLLPCPSALVVLLSAWSLGSISFGLALVLAFSLGLAAALTAIGLLLIYAGRIFDRLPKQMQVVKKLSAVSAGIVVLLGCGLAARSLVQIINNS